MAELLAELMAFMNEPSVMCPACTAGRPAVLTIEYRVSGDSLMASSAPSGKLGTSIDGTFARWNGS